MKPYSKRRDPKGISSRRKSHTSAHRSRYLRIDKKVARMDSNINIKSEI